MNDLRKAELELSDIALHGLVEILHELLDKLEALIIGDDIEKTQNAIDRLRSAIELQLELAQQHLANGGSLDVDAYTSILFDCIETAKIIKNIHDNQ